MPTPEDDNRHYLLRLWRPVLAACALLGVAFFVALGTGEAAQTIPILLTVVLAAVIFFAIRWSQKRRILRMLQAADPSAFLRSFAGSMRRIPHGSMFAAANTATILALYGRFDEAERALESGSWQGVPPLVQAQESIARATIAYARGSLVEGLDHAVAATHQGSLHVSAPGAKTTELALRTYRNLGLALAGRATQSTAGELRTAHAQLPLVGQILAAWGLARIAKSTGDAAEHRTMTAFIVKHAPHFTPVLESVAG